MGRLRVSLAIAFCAGVAFAQTPATLILRNEAGRVVRRIGVPDGRFVHVFVHSVNLDTVREEFVVEADGGLGLRRVTFGQYGAGMPSEAEGAFSVENGRFTVELDRRFSSLSLRVSPLAGHGIEAGGVLHVFAAYFRTGELVELNAILHGRSADSQRAGSRTGMNQ